ncbi:MAG: ATP-binding protein [Candidatus Kapaibacteriota bacterium]
MSWNKIIGLEREKAILQKSILKNRIHNSYLFYGMNGIGKRAVAYEFAKALNCLNPIIDEKNNKYEACDECLSCKQMSNLTHQNLHLIFSYPTGKGTDSKSDNPLAKLTDAQVEEIQNQMLLFAQNPYYNINITGANTIKIDQIREVKKKVNYSSTSHGKNVIIIMNAEEMTNEAANAFLKTLEEPSENTVIILTTSRKELLLQTILSRTQQLFFAQLSNEEIKQGLIKFYNCKEETANLISILANGSFSKALEQASTEFIDVRSKFVDIFRTVLKKKNYRIEFLEKIDELIKTTDTKGLTNGLTLFEMWLRDAYSFSLFKNKLIIVNLDQLDIIEKFTANFNNFDYLYTFDILEKSINLIKKSVNIQLILVNLFLGIRQKVYKFF